MQAKVNKIRREIFEIRPFASAIGKNDGCFVLPRELYELRRAEAGMANLDRMASEGMKLTSFYVAQPVCTASRAALV